MEERWPWLASLDRVRAGFRNGFSKTDIIPQKPSPTPLILEESQPPVRLAIAPAAAEGFVQLHKLWNSLPASCARSVGR